MDEIKHYIALKEFAIKNRIGIFELIKIFEINAGIYLNPCDIRMLNGGWAVISDDKSKLILTDKSKKLLSMSNVIPTSSMYIPKLSKKSGKFLKDLAASLMKDKATKEELELLAKYCKNTLALPFFFLFLQIFPTANRAKNKEWEKLFGAEYKGVTLRKATLGTAKKFETIIKTKDVGILLAGAYQHIVQSYNSESKQYYPKALENFFKEWEYWYDNAELSFKPKKEENNSNIMLL